MKNYVEEMESIEAENARLKESNAENERLNAEKLVELQKLEADKLVDTELDGLLEELESLVNERNQHKATNDQLIAESFNIQERLLNGEQKIIEYHLKLKEEQERKVVLEAKHATLIEELNQDKSKLESDEALIANGFGPLEKKRHDLHAEHQELMKQLELHKQAQTVYVKKIQEWKANGLVNSRSKIAQIRSTQNTFSQKFKQVVNSEGSLLPNIAVEYIEPVLQELGKDASNVDVRNPNIALENISNRRMQLKTRIHSQTIAKGTSENVFKEVRADIERVQVLLEEAEKENNDLREKMQGHDKKMNNWTQEKDELTKTQSEMSSQMKILNEKMHALKFETDKEMDEERKKFEMRLERMNLAHLNYNKDKERLGQLFKKQREEHNIKMSDVENNILRLQQQERMMNSISTL